MKFVLALDQGTTSSRAIVFNNEGGMMAAAHQEFAQLYPQSGWVEHDPNAIWESQLATMASAMEKAGVTVRELAAIGITNQRETTVAWDARDGTPVYNAIVWQDRRSAERCVELENSGMRDTVTSKTGLRLDPYFSATKLEWILRNVDGARELAEEGNLRFGTVDSWLTWKLTRGASHVTDVSNAARTMLFNIHDLAWDDDLLELFEVPRSVLPKVVGSAEVCGEWEGVPIAGMAGDQQAALFGQACFAPGDAKNTYGTGCFLLMNTGGKAVRSTHGLLTTVGWKHGEEVVYALEGSVFIGGAVFQWLRDELQLADTTPDLDVLAGNVRDTGGVVLVPAFAGLGAPHWDPFARGAMFGITRGTSKAHLCRAALESVALQSADLIECMEKDSGVTLTELRVDGGAARSDLLMQIQSDLLQRPVIRPRNVETTSFGAAALAGLGVGLWDRKALEVDWAVDRVFEPAISADEAAAKRVVWNRAVERTKGWER